MKPTDEKKQNRYVFACVANILYIIPCLSCLAMAVLLDGWQPPFLVAIITMVLNLPASLFLLHLYKKKQKRLYSILTCAVPMVLHLVCIPLIRTWYIILAPSLLLYILILAWSGVVEQH